MRCLINNPLLKKTKGHCLLGIFRKVGFIGDSMSSGEHEGTQEDGSKSYHDYFEYSWGQYIARSCGLEALNFSRGGLTCHGFFEQYITVNSPFEEEKKCQAYFIALGINDINHLDERYTKGFGSLDDVDFENEDNNVDSFIGQYVRIIQKLRKLESKCRIFVVTTAKEAPEDEHKRKYFSLLEKTLLELPKHFEFLYVIDIRKYGPTFNKKFGKKYFLGGHMSALGYKNFADMMIKYTDYLIESNPNEFAQVGFIGKGGVHNAHAKW